MKLQNIYVVIIQLLLGAGLGVVINDMFSIAPAERMLWMPIFAAAVLAGGAFVKLTGAGWRGGLLVPMSIIFFLFNWPGGEWTAAARILFFISGFAWGCAFAACHVFFHTRRPVVLSAIPAMITALSLFLLKSGTAAYPACVHWSIAGAVLVFITLLPLAWLRFVIYIIVHSHYRVDNDFSEGEIPEKGGALLLANHVSFIDALILLGCTSRRIQFMVYESFFASTWLRLFFATLDVWKVPGKGRAKEMHKLREKIRKMLEKGELVAIFPEGGISQNGVTQTFRGSVHGLLGPVDVPVIPIRLGLLHGSAFTVRKGKIRFAYTVYKPLIVSATVGKPIDRHLGEFEIRQKMHEMGAMTESKRQYGEMPLHYQLLRNAKKHPFTPIYFDALQDKGLSSFKMFLRAFILSRKVRQLCATDGEYVGVMLPNCVSAVVAIFAVMLADRVPALINYTAGEASREASLKKVGIKHILTSRTFLSKLGMEADEHMILLEDVVPTVTKKDKISSLLALTFLPRRLFAKLFFPKSYYDVFHTALILFSSGSSGQPKAVQLLHRNVNSDFFSFFRVVNWQRGDVVLGNLPLFHAFGTNVSFWVPTMARTPIVYISNPLDAALTGEAVHKHKVTLMMATPTFLQTYMRRCTREQFASLRMVITGGEKLRADIASRFKEMCGLSIVEGYGCTELSPIVSINLAPVGNTLGRRSGKPASIGVPMPGIFVRITDEDGNMCPPDKPGLLMVKGGVVSPGYFNDPEATAAVFKDGFYNTGDVAQMDTLGYITITGRLSRFSKISGEMVPHELIELRLSELLEVETRVLAVTGVPDAKRGERIIVLHILDDFDPTPLLEKLRELGLPNLWIPRPDDFHRVERMPILGSGKLDLQKLHEMVAEWSTDRVE